MKQVSYIKNEFPDGQGRSIAIHESTSDAQTDTFLTKRYIYLVRRIDICPKEAPAPEVRILKKIDTRGQREGFLFRVKGVVYIKKNRFVYELRYCHSLNVRMLWKTQVVASDKPAALA